MIKTSISPMLPGGVAVAVLLASGLAQAASGWVVMKSQAEGFKPGQAIADGQSVKLEAGKALTLISSSGKTLKLSGPFEGVPGAENVAGAGSQMVDSLRNLVAKREQSTSSLGVTRAASMERSLPDPWLVDVSHEGHRCIQEGRPLVLWRTFSESNAPVVLTETRTGWRGEVTWPAGYSKLAADPSMPLTDGSRYTVDASGRELSITLHVIPAAVAQGAVLSAWLAEAGCEEQALLLAAH
ncbi:MAG: hypothetical protein H7831_05185 [Magnetococcus sp. WYHC-3]